MGKTSHIGGRIPEDFTFHEVSAIFLDLLWAFGEKTTYRDDSYGGYHSENSKDASSIELVYLVKHAEEHGREGSTDPWSVRQMALYHRSNTKTGENIFFVINPSRAFQRRLTNVRGEKDALSPWQVHAIMLSSVVDQWRWYIGALEEQCSAIVSAHDILRSHHINSLQRTKAELLSVDEGSSQEQQKMDVHFSDTQDIQIIQDKLRSARQFIKINTTAMLALQHHLEIVFPSETNQERFDLFASIVRKCMSFQ